MAARFTTALIKNAVSLPTVSAVMFFSSLFWAVGRDQPTRYDIPNFGKVSAHLFRGAQPGVAGIEKLKSLGVGLIINLRMPEEEWKEEATEAWANGIAYTNVPMQSSGRPAEEQVKTVLRLIQTSRVPVFLHCHRGRDRTGTVVACYRIENNHWSSKDALREAKVFNMSWRRWGMRQFVKAFGRSNHFQGQRKTARIAEIRLVG
jgi:protein tyrosine/serine phosphatase